MVHSTDSQVNDFFCLMCINMNLLSAGQQLHFVEQGVLTLPGYLERSSCDGARQEINSRFADLHQYDGELIVNHGNRRNDRSRFPYDRDWVSVCFNTAHTAWPSVQLLWRSVQPLAEELLGKPAL